MKILLDIDDTFLMTRQPMQELLREFEIPFDPNEADMLWGREDLYRRFADAVNRSPGWVYALDPFPGALEELETLRGLGDVVAVTSPLRWSRWGQERLEALVERFGFHPDDIQLTHGKFHVPGDLFVDDSVKHCNRWAAVHPGYACLMTHPWSTARCARAEKDWRKVATAVKGRLVCVTGLNNVINLATAMKRGRNLSEDLAGQ